MDRYCFSIARSLCSYAMVVVARGLSRGPRVLWPAHLYGKHRRGRPRRKREKQRETERERSQATGIFIRTGINNI